jgi:hypothetical protein
VNVKVAVAVGSSVDICSPPKSRGSGSECVQLEGGLYTMLRSLSSKVMLKSALTAVKTQHQRSTVSSLRGIQWAIAMVGCSKAPRMPCAAVESVGGKGGDSSTPSFERCLAEPWQTARPRQVHTLPRSSTLLVSSITPTIYKYAWNAQGDDQLDAWESGRFILIFSCLRVHLEFAVIASSRA